MTQKFDLNRLKYEAVMEMLWKWRSAEIHSAAILLGLREGDRDAEREKADKLLVRIRIYADGCKPKAILAALGATKGRRK